MAACDQVDCVKYLIAVESLLPPAISKTSAGRSTRRKASGSDGTNGSCPGTSRRSRSPSLRPNQSRNESKAVMGQLSHVRHLVDWAQAAARAIGAARPSRCLAAPGTDPNLTATPACGRRIPPTLSQAAAGRPDGALTRVGPRPTIFAQSWQP